MKTIIIILTLLSCFSVFAEDLTTVDGNIYLDVKLQKITPCKVTIFHKTGIITVATGNLPDDFLKLHEIPFEQCNDFETDRRIALQDYKLHVYTKSKTKIILPDGTETDSSKIVDYNPIKIVFMFDSGVKSYNQTDLPKAIRDITNYSLEAANEYKEYLREEEIKRRKLLVRLNEIRKSKRLAQSQREELARIRKSMASYAKYDKPTSYGGRIWVNGYTRSDGTRVKGHYRSR